MEPSNAEFGTMPSGAMMPSTAYVALWVQGRMLTAPHSQAASGSPCRIRAHHNVESILSLAVLTDRVLVQEGQRSKILHATVLTAPRDKLPPITRSPKAGDGSSVHRRWPVEERRPRILSGEGLVATHACRGHKDEIGFGPPITKQPL
jgi:hypothetical protein